MNYRHIHPADQLAMFMRRIYRQGMTTTSGGNITYRDDDNVVWVTPAGIDKAILQADDIVQILPDGSFAGAHEPSSEYPFHLAALKARPAFRAILHAHSTALMSYSFLHMAPEAEAMPVFKEICGKIGVAKYATPGTGELAGCVHDMFAQGYDCVILENHGVVVGGEDVFEAFLRFETLEWCARTLITAKQMGYTPGGYPTYGGNTIRFAQALPEADFGPCPLDERTARKTLCDWALRSYNQRLTPVLGGSFSMRCADGFTITPHGKDRISLLPEDMVSVRGGKREAGKLPDACVQMHSAIYEQHPDVGGVIMITPSNINAFGLAKKKLDCLAIPEGYLMLKELNNLPFGSWQDDPAAVAKQISADTPALLIENDCLIATGQKPFDTYDKVEVAEYIAKGIIDARATGEFKPMTQKQADDFLASRG